MVEAIRARRHEKIRDYVDAHSKSRLLGALYALLFGPIGLIYTEPKNMILPLLAAVGLGLIYWPLIGVLWIGCVILAPFQVRRYNARIRRSARYQVM